MKNPFSTAARFTSRSLLAALASITLLAAFPAAAGIANTKHNLGSTNTRSGENATAGTDEICVFCHTPHAADTTAPVPLWNKALRTGVTGTTYTSYATLNTASLDGETLPVGSVSLACLSCHDGTQAMDNIINAPGSGGYDTTGGGANGLLTSAGWSWAATGRVSTEGLLNSGIASLGMDLSNDHPIGIAYCGGGISAGKTDAAANCKDKDFKSPTEGVINSKQAYWVDTSAGAGAGREKTDMILYTRAFAAGDGPSVECGSCHDPHVESSTTDTNSKAGQTFLRIANTGSAVCLACHVK